MKLSKIYCNNEKIFEDIEFNEKFNVIFGDVKSPEDSSKDSHNLGKTLLISVIEFLMLKELSSYHFIKENIDIFKKFEFYLEIELNSGGYVSIKRSVENDTKISFKKHKEKYQNFRKLGASDWDHYEVPIKKAKEILDSYLNLTSIKEWGYRKGISYFLRNQNDYQDVFQIEKFAHGDHIDWKPYMAKLLGFDDNKIKHKYFLDDKISKETEELKSLQSKVNIKVEDYDKLKGAIEIKESEIEETESKIDIFNFYEEELKINKNLVEKIEDNISDMNNSLYNIEYEIKSIEESLSTSIKFNLNEIKEIFEECKLYFEESLTKSYEEVLNFKKKVFNERKKYLRERLKLLEEERKKLLIELRDKNTERSKVLSFIRSDDSFKKFKELQNNLSIKRAGLLSLNNQLEVLDQMILIQNNIEHLDDERDELVKKINKEINSGNEIYKKIRKSFDKIIKRVLGQSAIISIKLNQSNNLEFNAEILKTEKSLETTSESKGTSWKKILCAAFDLSVLCAYSDKDFFRFVYHDGILEGLDNRKKKNFLEVVREYSDKYNLQYILTVISDDLPREDDSKLEFTPEEIILKLTDEGDEGRLFKMPIF